MWTENYKKVCELRELFGESTNAGTSDNEIMDFACGIEDALGKELPDELQKVYRITMGIEFNGHIFYGIDSKYLAETPVQKVHGLIEMNLTWYEGSESFEKFLFIAEHDLSWFVYDSEKKEYLELDIPSVSIVATYPDIDDMLSAFFLRATK